MGVKSLKSTGKEREGGGRREGGREGRREGGREGRRQKKGKESTVHAGVHHNYQVPLHVL